MKSPLRLMALAIFALAAAVSPALAKDDAPRGYTPYTELKAAQEKAAKEKKLVVLLVKGADDACPHCANAMETSEKAVGSGVVQVFARAEALNKVDKATMPAVLKDRASKKPFTEGAYVTVLVFDPAMTKIVAEANRGELDDNKDATAAFKKQVQEAKKEAK